MYIVGRWGIDFIDNLTGYPVVVNIKYKIEFQIHKSHKYPSPPHEKNSKML